MNGEKVHLSDLNPDNSSIKCAICFIRVLCIQKETDSKSRLMK